MKKLLAVAVLLTALFAAQNANGQSENNDVATMQTSLEQSNIYVIAKVEQTEPYSLLLIGESGCMTCGKPIKKAERLYERKFTNSCSVSVKFSYKFWNGEKWIPVAYTLAGGSYVYLPAGVDGSIKDFEE